MAEAVIPPGVHRVELPLPFGLGAINVYLVRLSDGWLLIDCGMDTPACFDALQGALAGLGIAPREIRHLLITHFHPDHVGLAPRILAETGAQLWMHPAEEKMLRWISDADVYYAWQSDILRSAGVGPALIHSIACAMEAMQPNFQALTADVHLTGGETIQSEAGPLAVVATPGHSPGHLCLYASQPHALFSFDHLLEKISPNIGWHPEHNALGDYLASLDAIAQLDADVLLPSHGPPFRGHRERVAAIRRHHEDRCARILAALAEGARTAVDVTAALWSRDLDPFHYRFAIFEVLAHLDYLRMRGEVGLHAIENGVQRWS
jgi:glyoxylase-like metal-dependent hydrolase (beta-lactamase superfamily II)